MAQLFFYSVEDVVDWMRDVVAETMETHLEDCSNNRSNLIEHGKAVAERKIEYGSRVWWLVRKDGAQMGSTFDMLVTCVNHYLKAFKHPDFTVYSIAYAPNGLDQWVVSW